MKRGISQMAGKRKSKQQLAAERAEILENLTESEKEIYRQRKEFISIQKNWRDYFAAISSEETQELLIAIFDYEETGKTPQFKSKMLKPVFTAMIKPVLDRGFADWCYSCHNNAEKGGKGGEIKAIRQLALKTLMERTQSDNVNGVKYADLLKNVGWDKLREMGLSEKEVSNLQKAIEKAYETEKQRYYSEN